MNYGRRDEDWAGILRDADVLKMLVGWRFWQRVWAALNNCREG
jgi:hypothetical protein